MFTYCVGDLFSVGYLESNLLYSCARTGNVLINNFVNYYSPLLFYYTKILETERIIAGNIQIR